METLLIILVSLALGLGLGALWRKRRDEREAAPVELDLAGGLRLAGEPIEDGERVELLLPGRRWLAGELRREAGGWPVFLFAGGGAWEYSLNGARLRRPLLAARVGEGASFRRVESGP